MTVAAARIGVSACTAPSRRVSARDWLLCDDRVGLDEIRTLGNTPDGLLDDHDFMKMVLPVVRADFQLCETFTPTPGPPLDCPLLAIGGSRDAAMAEDARTLGARSAETAGRFRMCILDAGHFLIETHRDAVIDLVADDLAACLSSGEPADALVPAGPAAASFLEI